MKKNYIIIFLVMWLFFLNTAKTKAQIVDHIYTDFGGFWSSGVGNLNAIYPDNTHHLLGFRYNGVIYSTGVNDGLLGSLDYEPGDYKALPVANVNLTTLPNDFLFGFGELFDGIPNGTGSPPFPVVDPLSYTHIANIMSQILTSGIHGLNLGSAITNIPSVSPLVFGVSAINDTSLIGDDIPDIIITQMAVPNNTVDRVRFVDIDGLTVGNELQINFTSNETPSLGTWRLDLFRPNTGVTWEINGTRNIRLWARDLSDFGIDGTNYNQIARLVYELGGASDPAFLAYNAELFLVLDAVDDTASTPPATPVIIPVLDNDSHGPILEDDGITITQHPGNGSVQINPDNTITYTPDPGFIGTDTFLYQICDAFACDIATVTINIFCTKDPSGGIGNPTTIGISTLSDQTTGWPESIPNGFIVLESKNKGVVITRTSSNLIPTSDLVEGMLIYDTIDQCFKLYNGQTWNCIKRSCNEE